MNDYGVLVLMNSIEFNMSDVKALLLEEEMREIDDDTELPHDTAPSTFLMAGLELEQLQ